MHEFPPNVDDTSFGAGPLFLLIVLGVAVFFAWKVNGSPLSCFIWGVVATCFGFWSLSLRQPAYDPTYSVPHWNVVLSGTTAAVAVVALIRNIIRNEKARLVKALGATCLGVIPILLYALLPGTGHGPASRRINCKNNLKQIGLAMHNYHDVYQMFPLARCVPEKCSWRVGVLPYLGRNDLYHRFNVDVPWDAPENAPLQKVRVAEFSCPQRKTDTDLQGRFLTSYVVPTGDGTMFGPNRTTRRRDITDGTSNTMMVVEACGTQIVWTEPRDADVELFIPSINGPGQEVHRSDSVASSYHKGGAMIGLADGSVRFFAADTPPEIIEALLTVAGDDVPEYVP